MPEEDQLYQVALDEETVEVSASHYERDGGETKEEWPWKVLYNNEGPGDKWTANASSAYIRFRFKKPLLIRGYGLKSANQERDPKTFSFWIEDSLDEANPIKVHSAINEKFSGPWSTNIYRLPKAVFVN